MNKDYDFSKNMLQEPDRAKQLIKNLEGIAVKYAGLVGLFPLAGGSINVNGKTVVDRAFNKNLRDFCDTSGNVFSHLYNSSLFKDEEGKDMSIYRIMSQADMIDEKSLAAFEEDLAKLQKDANAISVDDTPRERDAEELAQLATYPMVTALTLIRVIRSAGNFA